MSVTLVAPALGIEAPATNPITCEDVSVSVNPQGVMNARLAQLPVYRLPIKGDVDFRNEDDTVVVRDKNIDGNLHFRAGQEIFFAPDGGTVEVIGNIFLNGAILRDEHMEGLLKVQGKIHP